MERNPLQVGDVVQIDPSYDVRFGGCFMQVTEPKAFGAMGFVQIPGSGRAYYRCAFEHMEYIGHAEWVPADEAQEAGDADQP